MSYEGLLYENQNWHSDHRWKAKRSSLRTVYKYCKSHDRVEEVSSNCFATRLVPSVSPAVHVWKPFWNTEMDSKPIYLESKAQYRRECAARNQVCPL